MSERRPATTIGELDIHLSTVMDTLKEVQQTVATLATRSYVDEQVSQVYKKIHESRPSTQLANAAKIAGGLLTIAAFLGLLYEVAVTLQTVRMSLPAPAQVAGPK